MNIVTIMGAHNKHDVNRDTLQSIKKYMTTDILMVVDGACWKEIETENYDVNMLEGFYHNCNKSPYRNICLSLIEASKFWPEADWFCYLEYDCLVASDGFRQDLEMASEGCLGFDSRRQKVKLPYLEMVLGKKIKNYSYLLGCCVFYKGDFVRKSRPILEKILYYTNDFSQGFFPDYAEYDIAECMLPTLAEQEGYSYGGLAKWDAPSKRWMGDYKRYPIRFRPCIEEVHKEASIIHPLKEYDDPLRQHYRSQR